MAEPKIDRYIRRIPKIFRPGINPIITALLEAWAQEDDGVVEQLQQTKSQLFVRTAEGQFLDRLASGLQVDRPTELPLLDETFQELIPNLSLKAKQIRNIFYDVCDVFWGPLFTRVNITSGNSATFDVSPGDEIVVSIDGATDQTIRATIAEIAVPGVATADEMATILGRISGVTASVITEQISGAQQVNIRTDTLGPRGSIEVNSAGSTMVSPTKLDFLTDERVRITNLDQRAVVYEIRNKELLIELPAIVPILLSTLKGSHHLHATSAIEPPIAPSNGIWQGSFLFNPTSGSSFTITNQSTTILEPLTKGNVFTKVTVADASNIPNEPGTLVFNFGLTNQEVPVQYIGRPNNSTILLDPAHVFDQTHLTGSRINVVGSELNTFVPTITGEDLAIYLTAPATARQIVQEFLLSLAAAGIVVRFEILLPKYKYICFNPFE